MTAGASSIYGQPGRTSASSGPTTDRAGTTAVSSIAPKVKAAGFHAHLPSPSFSVSTSPCSTVALADPLFRGIQGRPLATITYRRAWDRARKTVLTEEEYRSPLARRPYDLRHACLSTWLNGGVAATQVAEWAGHSVEMLLRVYAKCLDGQDEIAKRRIVAALADIKE